MQRPSAQLPLEVVIVGGGVAGLEVLMALRAHAGPRVNITLVSPGRDFVYRPLSVGEAFGVSEARRYPLDRIAEHFAAGLVNDELEWAATSNDSVFLRGGGELPYDALVLALGAHPAPAWEHVVTFTDSRHTEALREVLADAVSGDAESIAFVMPEGPTWPLPLYELALMTARHSRAAGAHTRIAIFTPEAEPLAVFGPRASADVAAALDEAGVTVARATTVDVTPDGDIVIPNEETPVHFERVVSVPRLAGPAPRGIPCDEHGFIPVDPHGLVRGREHVYAAGDGTDYPVKHGAIATQQADAVAEVIAKRAGAGIDPRPMRAVLRAELFTGAPDRHFLRADLGSRATPVSEASAAPAWWPASKVAGQFLAPYLAAQDAEAAQAELQAS
ncbi:MAG: sulfide:quinone oxidoreductase [Thermoleophilaceae bacterium]|nr:sulfide:quinone oxidoreductase [Thermoleophilaceae bacterium]